jgi:hypothetical protein
MARRITSGVLGVDSWGGGRNYLARPDEMTHVQPAIKVDELGDGTAACGNGIRENVHKVDGYGYGSGYSDVHGGGWGY